MASQDNKANTVSSKAKETRAASWARGQKAKTARREAQQAAEIRNRGLRASGKLTPWEVAKAARKARRAHLQRAAV